MKVKIYGAGSIGNHLAQASRRHGWEVCVVDPDKEALRRMKEEIYPARYGAWDEAIKLFDPASEPKGGFDVICVGTPPHVRMKVALEALKEKPKVLHLEKPLAGLEDAPLREFLRVYNSQKDTIAVVGYDHAVARSIQRVEELLSDRIIGEPLTLDVEFREHWQGIFKAHPWLSGPQDTYLGYSQRGGGAGGEHSHALHLFQHLSKKAGLGTPASVSGALQVVKHDKGEYDSLALFTIRTDKGVLGRVIQDVITHPTRKWARIQGDGGFIEWLCNGHPTGDLVRFAGNNGHIQEEIFEKKRPDDFYQEIIHIDHILSGKVQKDDSPIALSTGLLTLSILETAWKRGNVLSSIEHIT